jgi:hypothetical protein
LNIAPEFAGSLDISRAARHVRKLVDATDLDYV